MEAGAYLNQQFCTGLVLNPSGGWASGFYYATTNQASLETLPCKIILKLLRSIARFYSTTALTHLADVEQSLAQLYLSTPIHNVFWMPSRSFSLCLTNSENNSSLTTKVSNQRRLKDGHSSLLSDVHRKFYDISKRPRCDGCWDRRRRRRHNLP